MQVDESIRVDRGRLPPIQEFANEVPKLECEQIIHLLAFWQTGAANAIPSTKNRRHTRRSTGSEANGTCTIPVAAVARTTITSRTIVASDWHRATTCEIGRSIR